MAKAAANLAWLDQAARELGSSAEYRKLGSTDMHVGLAIGEQAYLVRFEAFGVSSINAISNSDLRDADFVIRMNVKEWIAYLKKRKKGAGPTLMSLDLDEGVIDAPNPLKKLKFERYNLSLQAFVDHGASLAA
ncbi:MAG: hypothetical protein O3A63_08810 [Proteobacteria bacterium]|nr:hypothetical protein [Pseudomonadota bacterium]